MSQSHESELRDLIARASDGTLTPVDGERLTELLKADPIAQEMYLDHMLIEGLLERELGAALPAAVKSPLPPRAALPVAAKRRRFALPAWFRHSHLRREGIPLAILMFVALGWFGWARWGHTTRHPLNLANSSFESASGLSVGKMSEASWYGDVAHVVEQYSGIKPLEGNRMVRFVKSASEPEHSCELYQIVDLKEIADALAAGPVLVEASASFNAIADKLDDGEYVFGISMFAYAEDPAGQPHVWPMRWDSPLHFSGHQTNADADAQSWQKVTTRLTLPQGTKYLVIQLAVIHRDPEGNSEEDPDEFPGQFADHVTVHLVKS